MMPIDDDEDKNSSPISPEIHRLIGQTGFRMYDGTDKAGVVILAKDLRATIVYVNPKFAEYLGTIPDNLVGRSLDTIALNAKPHSISTKSFVAQGVSNLATQTARAMQGGRFVEAFYQGGHRIGQTCKLKIYSIELIEHGEYELMLGYVDKLTRLEYWIELSNVSTAIDWAWKPIARFFLAGSWRPYVSSAMAVLVPIAVSKWPTIGALLEQIFGG